MMASLPEWAKEALLQGCGFTRAEVDADIYPLSPQETEEWLADETQPDGGAAASIALLCDLLAETLHKPIGSAAA